MTLKITRIVYGLLGVLYVLLGMGSMLLPTGRLPQGIADTILPGEPLNAFAEHLLQEFGTVVLRSASCVSGEQGVRSTAAVFTGR